MRFNSNKKSISLVERMILPLDKFDFMSIVACNFEGLKSEEEIESRSNQMIKIILQSKEMAKNYLEAGIL